MRWRKQTRVESTYRTEICPGLVVEISPSTWNAKHNWDMVLELNKRYLCSDYVPKSAGLPIRKVTPLVREAALDLLRRRKVEMEDRAQEAAEQLALAEVCLKMLNQKE